MSPPPPSPSGGLAVPAAWDTVLPLVAVAVVVVGVVLFVRALPRVRRAREADGVLVDVGVGSSQDGVSSWVLTVRYVDAAGREQQGTWAGSGPFDLRPYRVGQHVAIRYDPEDPGWIYLPGGSRPHPLLVGVLVALLGLGLLLVVQLVLRAF